MEKKTIGFIGNFVPSFSTENDRKWSFESLGHKVITFQENETRPEQLTEIMDDLDVLFYSHTHGWEIPNLREIFDVYKKAGIPTVSVHLDRWAGLARVKDMGNEATWFTEYQFMADGSPEAVEIYEKLGLRWHFLKPGVVKRDCYMAQPDHVSFPHEIVFTGSKGYHPEYPFRPKMIDFLQQTYGDRFGHYGNDGAAGGVMRGHQLNVLYSTAKVVVGDSCFGGRPRYVSDRYYEVRGRGGFLIHPYMEGIDRVGVGSYEYQDLDSLKMQIDYWLSSNEERESNRRKGYMWVALHETYTNRAEEMLNVIFG